VVLSSAIFLEDTPNRRDVSMIRSEHPYGRGFRRDPLLVLLCSVLVTVVFACGSSSRRFGTGETSGGNDSESYNAEFGETEDKPVVKLEIDPPQASLDVTDGAAATRAFKAIATFADNTKREVTSGVVWSSTNRQVGNVGADGVYTTSGSVGGRVKVSASFKEQSGSADLSVKLHLLQNPANVDASTITALKGATQKDVLVTWAYPYDGTVFPRGLAGPLLMWNNGAEGDLYYIRLTSQTFELEALSAVPPPSRYAFSGTTWQRFVDSTSGASELFVARYAGGVATVAARQNWSIAPASMRGTIYYWANNKGRVMRIKPGADVPDDFSAGTFGALPESSCTMTCHTVSADGSTLVSGGDTLGGSYDLLKNQPIFDTGGAPDTAQKRLWSNAALSPNGKYLVQNSSDLPGPPGKSDGLWDTKTGARVPSSGLDGVQLGMPAFAADGTKIAYVGVTGPETEALSVFAFDLANAKATAPFQLVAKGSGGRIAWPSISPDSGWIIYHRGPLDTRDGNADLFLASSNISNQEIRLANLNGDVYPFAAGTRDRSLNYEPTFAPVASGGYFWVVFTSRRTYGNYLTGDSTVVKQLWVAAIDMNPAAGSDPSHPAFLLPGQDLTSLNMRGFWALDPCKGDGQGCASGTECCGGYCDDSDPNGALVCKSAGVCARNGDHCTQSSDCCEVALGSTCINHVCAEGPK
jgi:hypothetical protein